MQRSNKYYPVIRRFINYFLGPLLFVWLSFSIYTQIKNQSNLELSWLRIRDSINSTAGWNLLLVALLMVANWSIETWKWKLAVSKIQKVDFAKAFKAILSGVSFSVSTPNRMGEYLGRVLYIEEGNRLRTISITIVSSMSQLIVTLLMGCLGLFFLKQRILSADIASALWVRIILSGTIIVLLGLTILYFRLARVIKWLDRLPGSSKYAYLVNAVEDFNATLLLRLLSLSVVRFIVFAIQYYLLFRLFGVDVTWWQGFWSVSVTFLVMAVIPTIALLELVQKGKVILKVVTLFSTNELGIGLTVATIWFINLVIPAIFGSLLILSIKIFRKQNEMD